MFLQLELERNHKRGMTFAIGAHPGCVVLWQLKCRLTKVKVPLQCQELIFMGNWWSPHTWESATVPHLQ